MTTSTAQTAPAPLPDEQFCYLVTTGRTTGRTHEVEMWFALPADGSGGHTIYALSGGGDRSDWVRNLRATPDLQIRIAGTTYPARARLDLAPPEDLVARQSLAAKYYAWTAGDLPNTWSRQALPVAFDLGSPTTNAPT